MVFKHVFHKSDLPEGWVTLLKTKNLKLILTLLMILDINLTPYFF